MLIACIFLISGCATSYQAKGAMGGFSSTQLAENVFDVKFSGNGFTSPEKASDFALLRSAELAIEQGYGYFAILDSQNWSKDRSYTIPGSTTSSVNVNTSVMPLTSYGPVQAYSGYSTATVTTHTTPDTTYHSSKPRSKVRIYCFKHKPQDVFTYNAYYLVNSFKQKYGLQ